MNNDDLRLKCQEQLREWNSLIRSGQSSQVSRMCRELNYKSVPRDLLLDYAQIARRIGAPDLIVFWYAALVREEKALDLRATESEKAIYALGLSRLGAFREAEQILVSLKPEADPQIRFYRASLYTTQWLYRKAIPEWKKYVCDQRVPFYSRMVGRVNLCASLVSLGRYKPALKEISVLMKRLEKNEFWLLKGNLHEVRSQLYFQLGRLEEAMAELDSASAYLKNADLRSQIYVAKWKAILQIDRSLSTASTLAEIEEIKLSAQKAGDWESVRDCDLQLAVRTKNQELLLRVYWGTIFSEYKVRALKLFGWKMETPKTYIWESSINDSQPLDLVQEAPTPVLRKLFFILTRELYRPLHLTEIFDALYEDEYYNPKSGAEKLRRVIVRARLWLKEKYCGVQIYSHRGGYKLHCAVGIRLLLQSEFEYDKSFEIPASFLSGASFTASQWAEAINLSGRTARRQLRALTQSGKLQSYVRGPKTYYRTG